MLVMSRRKDQKIVFPGLGITVTLIGVRGNTARLGIDAPRDVTILREEIIDPTANVAPVQADPHSIRNVLNSVNLFVMVYQKQMESNRVDAAAATFMKMVEYLELQTKEGTVDFNVSQQTAEEMKGRVMVVEDDPDQRDLLSSLLAMQGLDVCAHQDGHSALQDLRNGAQPEIILLDWNMPEFGGQWLVPKVRNEFGGTGPKLFVVSGTDATSSPQRDSVDAWLAKPLNQDALLARLRAVYSAC